MNQENLPENEHQAAPVIAPAPGTATQASERSVAGIAWLALLLAVFAASAAGWAAWQLRVLPEPDLGSAEQAATRAQLQALAEEDGRLITQLQALSQDVTQRAQLEPLITQLQTEQQRQAQRLTTLQDGGRQVLRLVEAEHLLRLAGLRLSAMQDADSAIALIQGADEVLREQNDPAAFAARKQLAQSLEQLRSLPYPDRTGLFLQLAALREQALSLHSLSADFVAMDDQTLAPDTSRWQRWWAKISSFVRIDLQADQDVRPLLAGQSLAQVRLALSLAVEQAQWAVLHGEDAVYRQALAQAQEVLAANFNQNQAANQALYNRLGELAQQPVSVQMPDLNASLKTFQTYLQQRQSPQPETPKAAVEQESAQ